MDEIEQRIKTELKLEGFEQWLKSKKLDEVVGHAEEENCCPIATCLESVRLPVGVSNTCVSGVVRGAGVVIVPHSPISNRFVEIVDECKDGNAEVTAAEALEVLDRCKAELAEEGIKIDD